MQSGWRDVVKTVLTLEDWCCDRNAIDSFIVTAYLTLAGLVLVHVRTESQAAALALVLDCASLLALAAIGVIALRVFQILAFALSVLW